MSGQTPIFLSLSAQSLSFSLCLFSAEIVLKAKWKGLRDNFRVEYKRIPRADNGDFLVDPATFESKWLHYYALLFLSEFQDRTRLLRPLRPTDPNGISPAADHMRHRLPKNEQDQSYYFNQQSQDCEKTVVEPDLTNGLIRRLQDSDEDFDEDDLDADTPAGDASDGSRSLDGLPTPPAAHQQTHLSTTPLATGALKAQEEAFAASHQHALLKAGLLRAQLLEELELEKEAQDLTKKSTQTPSAQATPMHSLQTTTTTGDMHAAPAHCSPPPVVTTTSTHSALATAAQLVGTVLAPATTTSSGASSNNVGSHIGAKRSVSPPPLYNKAHHPLPTASVGHHTTPSKDDFPGGASNGGGSASDHLNFTQHSYVNGLIPALKLKRPRLSEDSNFNGSSTMDAPLVPEDDDYHYLLSLHPYMKQLTAAQKLRIRTKIQKLIFKELYKEDLEESK